MGRGREVRGKEGRVRRKRREREGARGRARREGAEGVDAGVGLLGDLYSFVVGKGRGSKLLQVSGEVEEKFSYNFVHLCFRVFRLGIVH